MSFSVIVKTFMRPDMLDQCLSSLERLKPQPDMVVVADDGHHTSDELGVYERHKDTLNLKPLLLPYDIGISKARNMAFKACSKDSHYILLLDDDMEPPSNIFEVHEVMEEDLQKRSFRGYPGSLGSRVRDRIRAHRLLHKTEEAGFLEIRLNH